MNPHIVAIEPSLIRSINSLKRPGDIDLGLGEPTLLPDLDAFAAALEWTRINGSPYSPNAGFPDLRAAITAYLVNGAPPAEGTITKHDVCVTVGSEEAIYLAIKTVVDPARDEVLIVEPCYLAYSKICVLEGIRHRSVALSEGDGFRPSAAAVLAALRHDTRLVIINTPSNPTGRVWPREELQALADGLKARRDRKVFILADEVYRELFFDEQSPGSIADYYQPTLVAGSLSKCGALTGLRLGWLSGPAEAIAAAVKVHQLINTAASTFSQRVALELFRDPSRLAAHREIYMRGRERLLAGASRNGLDVIPPEGSFYAFLRLPISLGGDSVQVAERLLEERRVVTVPGRAFGQSGEGWLRISWVAPPEVVEEGMVRLADWFAAQG